MKVLDKHRLELRWQRVWYKGEVAILDGAYFCGPVLKDTERLRENDNLTLDMTDQHLIMVPDFYQAKLSWKQVVYKDNKIFLPGVTIKGKYVNSLERLTANDWILIDCKNHDDKNHPYHLVYYAKVMKKEGECKY